MNTPETFAIEERVTQQWGGLHPRMVRLLYYLLIKSIFNLKIFLYENKTF